MSIVAILYKCEECGAECTSQEGFPHERHCSIPSKQIFDKKKELLSEWLRKELPNESMSVYGWPGLNRIAHNLLVQMNNSGVWED